MRAQAEWKVITHMARVARPTRNSTRSRISCAALLVNVIARISFGLAWPVRSSHAIRCVSTRVLPEPAPARTSSGPPGYVTASRCGGFRPSSSSAIASAVSGMPSTLASRPAGLVCAQAPASSLRDHARRMALTEEIRDACAWVAARARQVRIVEPAIEPYARTLPGDSPPAPDLQAGAAPEARAAFSLQLNAINFGSGWFPTLRKPPGCSGFRTVEGALRRHGPWTADELARLEAGEVARVMGQDPRHELMALFARALRELGGHVAGSCGGSFVALARSGEGSAVALAERLAGLPTWRDVSPYDGRRVPFFKRAQIAAADPHLQGLAPARDLAALTLFADNLVPHVLRLDGVLEFAPELVERIAREELIAHDSAEEVEIRACALHAVELLVAAHGATTATAVDNALWHRGAGARYKAVPRHRARTTAY